MKRFTFLIGVAAAALATATPAMSQEVVMRRPLIVPTKGADWRVTPFVIYDINGNVVQPANACGPYEERRDVDCVVKDKIVGDSYCREAGPKPEESRNSFIDTGCSYDWYQGQWQDPGPSCSNAEAQERIVECRRSYDNVKVSESLCSGTKPATERTVVDHSTCTYSWNSSDPFSDPGASCTATEEWTRDVYCERDLDKVEVADGQCDASSKPATVDLREDYSSCSYSWDADETFVDPGASCTDSEVQTRAVWCRRDLDDNVEADSQCDAASRPAASQTVEDFSGCSYSWDPQAWGAWSSTCSTTATRTRSIDCLRSDGTVTNDMAARCLEDDGAKPATSETQAVYGSCTYDWTAGAWQDPGSSCTANESQTRTVTCRSSDGRTVADSFCTKPKLATTRTVEDYSSCTYAWVAGGFQDPGASCTANETQTQTVTCRRSDGTTVANSECNPATKPPTTQTVADYSACSYDWVAGGFGAWSNTCSSNATRTQTVTCRRSDGTTVPNTNCNAGTKPATSETSAVYSGCSYDWISGAWQDPGASCTANESQTRSVTCRRSDGTTVANSNCDAGSKPATSQTVADYSGCSYSWNTTAWQDPGASCTASESQTRTVTCRRSDGTTVADSNCSGTKPASTQTVADYSGCSYSWQASGFGAWSNTCTSNATRTQTVTCRRSDGTTVSDSNCNAGTKPATSETSAVYSGCSYDWISGAWQDPGASCTASETQTRSVTCRRSDGATVSNSNCDSGSKPATSQTVADYSGCSYDWVEGGFGAWSSTCSSSATRTQTVTCRRGDGTTVSNSLCNSGSKPATSETSAVYSGCSYSAVNWTNPANPTCSASNTETQTADCQRGDGTIVSDSNCTSRSIALTRTVTNAADYSGCSYSAVNWTNPANPTCSAANTETQTADCRRSDGTIVSDSTCTGRGISLTRTVSNSADYSGCSYQWITGGWQDPGASCTPNETQNRSVSCRRTQTGETVSDSYCGGGKPSTSRTVEDYSGCSTGSNLTVNWGGWSGWSSSCSTSATRSRSGTCMASGSAVASSVCTDRGLAVTQTESSAQYSGCTYTPSYGAWGTCQSPGTQSASMTGCTRNGVNQSVSISYCTNAGHPNPRTRSCTLTPGTGPVLASRQYGGEGQFCQADTDIDSSRPSFPTWCRNAGGTLLQRRSVFCEATRDPYGEPYEQEYWEYCREY